MPMNVGEAITPAMAHTNRLLFKPFVLRKWLALGLVSILAEIGGGNAHFNLPADNTGQDLEKIGQEAVKWVTGHIGLIILGFIFLLAISLLLSWLGSVFKFVYLNQITRVPLAIREPFHRFTGLGTSFFLWQLAFGLVSLVILAVLVGVPLFAAFAQKTGPVTQVLAIAWAIIVGVALVICMSVVNVFARDFVLTTMFARGAKVLEAWNTVIPILKANVGQSILYIGMLIIIGIVTGIGSFVAVLAVMLAFAIPAGILALIGWGIYAASGNHWSAGLIAYSVIVGTPLFLAFLYASTCAMQPFLVFRKTYTLVVLGQADPALATVPIPPATGPRVMPEDGI